MNGENAQVMVHIKIAAMQVCPGSGILYCQVLEVEIEGMFVVLWKYIPFQINSTHSSATPAVVVRAPVALVLFNGSSIFCPTAFKTDF